MDGAWRVGLEHITPNGQRLRVRLEKSHGQRSSGLERSAYVVTLGDMCRNIRPLFNFAPPATEEEIRAAALQYVRKVSGVQKPSQVNLAQFERAVAEVTQVTRQLVETLVTSAPPRDRDDEREKARVRNVRRFGPRAER